MQVFHAFFKIAKKHLKNALIYFTIYAALTIMLSLAGRNAYTEQFQAASLNLVITDEDQSPASAALLAYLGSLHNIKELPDDDAAVFDQIYYRTLHCSLTIPQGFEAALLTGETDDLLSSMKIPGSTVGFYVNQQISQYLKSLQLYLAGGSDIAEAVEKTDAAIASLPTVETVSFRPAQERAQSGAFYFFQYLPYIYIAILFTGLAPILVRLNSSLIRARTVCSSLMAASRSRQLAFGCALYSLGVCMFFMILGIILYRSTMLRTDVLLGVLNSFVFLLFAAAVTLLVSLFAPDNNVLNMLSNIIGLSTSFLCGMFVPQSMLPDYVLNAGRFLPAYWYIRANNMLAGFGNEVFDMRFYWLCIGIQLLFAAVILAITFVTAKQRQQQ